MIKDHIKIVLMTLIVFISLSSNVFSRDMDDESDSTKTKIVLAKQGDVEDESDITKAKIYLAKLNLAMQGDLDAQYELGLMNSQEGSTPENLQEALFWFGEALKGGHPSAKEQLTLVVKKTEKVLDANAKEIERLEENGKRLKKESERLEAKGKKIDEKYAAQLKGIDEAEAFFRALEDSNPQEKEGQDSRWCSCQ